MRSLLWWVVAGIVAVVDQRPKRYWDCYLKMVVVLLGHVVMGDAIGVWMRGSVKVEVMSGW